MRGLIYKDVCLFFKSVEKGLLIMVAIVLVLLAAECGETAGLLATVMLAMTVGIQNVLVFAGEEKTEWGKYQRTLPVKEAQVIVGKYAAVLITMAVSIGGCVVFNGAAFIFYRTFSWALLGLSAAAALIIPLCWTALSLPVCYWFGFQTAQYAGIVLIFPVFFTVKYFEDASYAAYFASGIEVYLAAAVAASGALYAASLLVSIAGYRFRRVQ